MDNQSLWLDVKIIAMTIGKILKREGISQPGHATAEEFNPQITPIITDLNWTRMNADEHGYEGSRKGAKDDPGSKIQDTGKRGRVKARVRGGEVAEDLFRRGFCLPSGTAMTEEDLKRVVKAIRRCWKKAKCRARERTGVRRGLETQTSHFLNRS